MPARLSTIDTAAHAVKLVRDSMRRRALYHRRPDNFTLNTVELYLGSWVTNSVRSQIYDGTYEDRERVVVTRTLRDDDIVLELGCGMGYMTTIAARIARCVHSYDANPEMAEVARATVARNQVNARINVGAVGASPTDATVPFYVSEQFLGSSLRPFRGARPIDVPLADFADACKGCSYLLVDIEGAEVQLLQNELPGIRAICVECHPGVATSGDITTMLASLFEHGFELDLSVCAGEVLYLSRG